MASVESRVRAGLWRASDSGCVGPVRRQMPTGRSDWSRLDIRVAVLRPFEGNALVTFCIHLANVVYLFSFLVRDILWLRSLTCVGMVLGIVFFACQPTPLYGPTFWHVVFLVINGFQIWRLVLERRQLMLTKEQERFCEATFQGLSREELLTLLTRAMGEKPERLQDIDKIGTVQLSKDEQILRNLAFSHLSRQELLNLLTRRFWNSIKRRYPARWKRRSGRGREAAPVDADLDVSWDSATG
jgi:hypothetical protein